MSRSEKVIGKEFEKLKQKTVAIVGVGGTGCAVAQLLARLPLKKLILIDGDFIEESNLERQVLYSKSDIGKQKVIIAKEKLHDGCPIETKTTFITKDTVDFTHVDLIVDCTDNMDSRILIDTWCKTHSIPWLYTGAVGNIGTVLFVDAKVDFQKYFSNKEGDTCCSVGVLNSLVVLIGSLATKLAIDFLTHESCEKKMLRVNAKTDEFLKISIY